MRSAVLTRSLLLASLALAPGASAQENAEPPATVEGVEAPPASAAPATKATATGSQTPSAEATSGGPQKDAAGAGVSATEIVKPSPGSAGTSAGTNSAAATDNSADVKPAAGTNSATGSSAGVKPAAGTTSATGSSAGVKPAAETDSTTGSSAGVKPAAETTSATSTTGARPAAGATSATGTTGVKPAAGATSSTGTTAAKSAAGATSSTGNTGVKPAAGTTSATGTAGVKPATGQPSQFPSGTSGTLNVVPARATPSADLPVPPSQAAVRAEDPIQRTVEEKALGEARRFFHALLAGDARMITGRAGYPFFLESKRYETPDTLLPEWIRHLRANRSDLLTIYGIEILTPEEMESKYGKPPARLASLPYKAKHAYVAVANISGRAAIALLRDTPNGFLVIGFTD